MKETKMVTITIEFGRFKEVFDFIAPDTILRTYIDEGEIVRTDFVNYLFYEMIYKQAIDSYGKDEVKVYASL